MTKLELIDLIKAEARAVNIENNINILINTILIETLRSYISTYKPYEYRKELDIAGITGTKEYDLPTDFLIAEDVMFGHEGTDHPHRPLTRVNSRIRLISASGWPSIYFTTTTKLCVFPYKDISPANNIKLIYFQEPSTNFTSDNDVVIFSRFQAAIRDSVIRKINRYHKDE